MAKTRNRRVTQGSDSTEKRVGRTQAQVNEPADSAASNRKLIAVFVFFFIVIPAASVLVYHIKCPSNTNNTRRQQSLIQADVNYQDILTEHSKVSKNASHREFTHPVLAYVTPWNAKGYEMAKRFTNKFTHLSPVWYDLKSKGSELILEGRHNADRGWLSEIRKNGDALVLPRVVLEAFPMEMLIKKNVTDYVIELLVSECKEMEYDGIVLESWSRWQGYLILHDLKTRKKALQFIKQLADALHSVSSTRNIKQHLQLIYVIGPPHSEKFQPYDFGPQDLQSLSDAVDGFSLMTYDFSSPNNPGPNAPLKWIHHVLQLLLGASSNGARAPAYKIFLGISFYGNDFHFSKGSGGGAIVGRDYLSLLEKHKPKLQWEKNSGEHFFLYVDDEDTKHLVFYPSLMSLSLRLDEARLWGTGVSIWEIGQGLDYFFDLL
ncbi:chitinase domain-containing protein 1 [Ricinus communis]|nr:chitinase domain-containing protein 1 [Ricinus communis]|eukprot:XP_015577356.1 chitinase domain-containing protein 1 [Ricinus communis]